MQIPFTKMHGLGNDFVVVDAFVHPLELTSEQVRGIADRRRGIGCDQLLMVLPGDAEADFSYDIRNADGTSAGQCGNGARCLARFAADLGYAGTRQRVRAPSGMIEMEIGEDASVRVDMGAPGLSPDEVPFDAPERQDRYALEVAGRAVEIAAVSIGNPHAVLEVDSADEAQVADLGPLIETHPGFPQGANVGFLEIEDAQNVRLRVWERGAGETTACGSGACAAVVAGRLTGALGARVSVHLPGGVLRVDWHGEGESVHLRGAAEYAFSGTIEL